MEDTGRVKKTYSRIGIAYTVFLVLGVGLQLEAALIVGFLNNSDLGITVGMNGLILLSMLPMYLIGAPVCYLILKDLPTVCRPPKQSFSAVKLVICFIICISVMYLGNIMGIVLMGIVNTIQGKPFANPVDAMIRSMNTGMIFVIMVVLAPIVEEFLCRRLLIDRIRQYGERSAILVSGLVFGLMHGNFYQFFYAFGLGVIFAYIYCNTGKLRYTIAFHALINFMGSILALYVMDNQTIAAAYGIFMLIAVILGIVFLIIFRKRAIVRRGPEELPENGRFAIQFLNPGMILFFLSVCVMFLLMQFS